MMATLSETSPVTVPALIAAKGREPIAMMTAYDAPSAALLDEAGLDVLLVGDSAEMTVYGRQNTLSATMDSMVRHAAAVSGRAKRALVVGDMPFLSYQTSVSEAVANAGRFLSQAGCAAVKVEGGRRVLPAVEAILAADIPVMGHVGLTPAVVPEVRGLQGPGAGERRAPARSWKTPRLSPRRAASRSSSSAFRRTRGGNHAGDSRAHDRNRRRRLLRRPGPGLPRRRWAFRAESAPRFVRRYANLAPIIEEAARAFTRDVKSRDFPSEAESYADGSPPALAVAGCDESASSFWLKAQLKLTACSETSPSRFSVERLIREARAPRASPSASSRRWGRCTKAISPSCGGRERPADTWSFRSSSTRSSSRRARTSTAIPGASGTTPRCSRRRARTCSTCRDASELYPPGFSTSIEVARVSHGGEGAARPGHFRGVATVVAKLFLQVQPDAAFFGRKDLQQVAVIRRMARDLDFPISIEVGETVREPDGLALSSRNAYLSADERQIAAGFPAVLFEARDRVAAGERRAGQLEKDTRLDLESAGLAVDYVEVVDPGTMSRRRGSSPGRRSAPPSGRGRPA